MNTSLFTNVFKSLFGSSITPTASQFVPITAQDGTPAGLSSMAKLANVWVGLPSTGSDITTGSDLNSYTSFGYYVCPSYAIATSLLNKPEVSDFGAFKLEVKASITSDSQNRCIQTIYVINGNIYSRTKSANEWSSWSRIDNFGCSTPSALASALGVSNGYYRINSANQTLNKYLKIQMDIASVDIYLGAQNKTASSARIIMGHSSNNNGKYIVQGSTSISAYYDSNSLYISLAEDGFIWFNFSTYENQTVQKEIVSSLPSGVTQLSLE